MAGCLQLARQLQKNEHAVLVTILVRLWRQVSQREILAGGLISPTEHRVTEKNRKGLCSVSSVSVLKVLMLKISMAEL